MLDVNDQQTPQTNYRRPKQVRSIKTFEQILKSCERKLETGLYAEFTLNDIASDLSLSVGTIYHFFPSKEALLLALADQTINEFKKISRAVDLDSLESWQDYFRIVYADSREFFIGSKSAMILTLGPAYNWDIRLADAAGNAEIAATISETLQNVYDFSFLENLTELVLRGIVISDAIWRRSFCETGTITPHYQDMAVHTALIYLEQFIPRNLLRRKK